MSAESRKVLGYGLLAGAAGIALLMLLWLFTSGVEAGGAVLGLLLLFVFAGPLAGAGYYVLAQGRTERVYEQQFASKRRILDADRLFRRELNARLRQLAARPGAAGQQVRALAESVDSSALTDETAWYDAVQLDDSQAALLRQYDDLVWERVNWLRDHPADPPESVLAAVKQLQVAIDQRTDLLIRGRAAPAVGPTALLRAGSHAGIAIGSIAVGDAVTYDGNDYVAEGLATVFSNGQTSKLVHLNPSGPGASEHWLLVSPGGLEAAWLSAMEQVVEAVGSTSLSLAGAALPLAEARSATVQVESARGSTPGVLVNEWIYRSDGMVALVDQWPDGTIQAYNGSIVDPGDLEIWSAAPAASRA